MGKESVVVEREGKMVYDWSNVDTVGNHSYIPCRRYEWPKEEIRHFILELLTAFEEAHPEFEVTNWRDVHEVVCGAATNQCEDPYLCGLWVDHRPRVKALEERARVLERENACKDELLGRIEAIEGRLGARPPKS